MNKWMIVSYIRNLSSCEKKAWKIFRLGQDSNFFFFFSGLLFATVAYTVKLRWSSTYSFILPQFKCMSFHIFTFNTFLVVSKSSSYSSLYKVWRESRPRFQGESLGNEVEERETLCSYATPMLDGERGSSQTRLILSLVWWPVPFARSYTVGREDKRTKNRTMNPTLKTTRILYFKSSFVTILLCFSLFFFVQPPREVCIANRNIGQKFVCFFFNKYISVILAFVVYSVKLVTSAVGISLPSVCCIWNNLLIQVYKWSGTIHWFVAVEL